MFIKCNRNVIPFLLFCYSIFIMLQLHAILHERIIYVHVHMSGCVSLCISVLHEHCAIFLIHSHVASSPGPAPKNQKRLLTLASFPVTAESAVLILGRPITFVHFQLPCQLLNSVRCGKLFTGKQRVKAGIVAIPRLALEVRVGEVNAVIEGAVRRLRYNVPTTEQKDVVTTFVAEGVFSSPSPRVAINHCATRAYLTYVPCYTVMHACIPT